MCVYDYNCINCTHEVDGIYLNTLTQCLLFLEINADTVDSCYVNGTHYEMWQSWSADAGGECVQYKCTRRGIVVNR